MTAKYPSTLAPQGLLQRTLPVLLPVLSPYFSLSTTRNVLELSSGEGLHSLHFSQLHRDRSFQPTEADQWSVDAINTNLAGATAGDNIRKAVVLDLLQEEDWKRLKEQDAGTTKYQIVFGINFLHMVPCPHGPSMIFSHLHSIVDTDDKDATRFLVYGPFKNDQGFFTENDEKFNTMIQQRPNGSQLGLRSIDELERIAASNGWELEKKVDMPVGNFVLVFKLAS